MKKLLSIIFLAIGLTCHAQQLISVTVTVTNAIGTANTNTLTINGVTRNFTNFVASYQSSILASNTQWAAASNIYSSYIQAFITGVTVSQPTTNTVRFFPNPTAVSASLSTGWGTLTFFTNNITNSIVVRVPPSSVGIYDLTNIANGLSTYLSSVAVTNPISLSAPAFANFATLANIQAYSLLNTNFTLFTSNLLKSFTLTIGNQNTNFSLVVSNYFYNLFQSYNIPLITGYPDGPAFKAADFFQPSNNVLTQFVANYPLGLPANLGYYGPVPVIGGYGNDIVLQQTNHGAVVSNVGPNYDPNAPAGTSIDRLDAFFNQPFNARFEDGAIFLIGDTSHNFNIQDHAGTIRWQMFDPTQGAPLGGNVFRGSGNENALTITANGIVGTWAPAVTYAQHWPTVAAGTVTNFTGLACNTNTPATLVDYVVIPPNTMTNNGDSITRTISVEYANGSSTKAAAVVFNGTTIIDTGGVVNTSATGQGARVTVELTVQNCTTPSSAVVAYSCSASINGTSASAVTKIGTVTVDLTASPTFNVTLTAASGSTRDEIIESDNVKFYPAAAWQGVQ